MKRILIVLVGFFSLAGLIFDGPAWGLEALENNNSPLTKKGVSELYLLSRMLDQVAYQVIENVKAGKEPLNGLVGTKPMDLVQASSKRTAKAEQKKVGSAATKGTVPSRKGWQNAGGGFASRRVRTQGGAMPMVIGELQNKSGRSYQIANFTVTLFDRAGNIAGTAIANVSNFRAGSVKTFQAIMMAPPQGIVSRIKVSFENGF